MKITGIVPPWFGELPYLPVEPPPRPLNAPTATETRYATR